MIGNGIELRSVAQFDNLVQTLKSASATPDPLSIFVGTWRVQDQSDCCSSVYFSAPMGIHLGIELSCARRACGSLALAWKPHIQSEMLMEGFDYIEIDACGSALHPSGKGSCPIHTLNSDAWEQAEAWPNRLEEPVVCFLRIELKFSGELQPVTLSDHSMRSFSIV